MPFQADLVFRDRDTIMAELIAALQARIPNAAVEVDTVWRILFEVVAGPIEGLFQAVQLLHNDMFPQTAEAVSLIRYGEQYGLPEKAGSVAAGNITITGDGGTYVPVGVEVAAPQVSEDALLFTTTVDGTIPNPGIPTAPTVADRVMAGNLTGTYEWGVTFVTVAGETAIGAASAALVLAASQAALTNIPLGGPGTTRRRVYRMLNGGNWQFAYEIADNVTTAWNDNIADGTLGGGPPSSSTAEQITLAAQSEEAGLKYNVQPGTITEITSSQPGLTSVTNPALFSGGTDAETTEDFRTRLLDFLRNPKSGSKADLEGWAMTVDGIDSATAFPNDNVGVTTPGHVTVRVSGPGGSIPDGTTQANVLDELLAHDLANITIHVATFVAHPLSPTVNTTLASGYTLADVTDSVSQAVAAYINSVPVGGTVYASAIIATVMALAGIVNVTTTFVDTTVGAIEKPTVGTITVN